MVDGRRHLSLTRLRTFAASATHGGWLLTPLSAAVEGHQHLSLTLWRADGT